MRPFFISLVLIAACAAPTVDRSAKKHPPAAPPVDGKYVLALTALKESCTSKSGADAGQTTVQRFADSRAEADVFLRPDDGLIDLRHGSNWLPGALDGAVRGIARKGDVVDFRGTASTSLSTTVTTVSGTIAPDALTIDYEERYSDELTDCAFSGHAEGASRPFADPRAVGGSYAMHADSWPLACPASDSGQPYSSGIARVEAYDDGGSVRLSFGEGAVAFVATPGEDGAFSFDGDADVIDIDLDTGSKVAATRHATAAGTMRPDGADIRFTVDYPEYGAGCGLMHALQGAKLVARTDSVPGDYRMKYRVQDDCAGSTYERYGTSTLYDDGATLQLVEPRFAAPVTLGDGGKFQGETGDVAADGYHISVSGDSHPPSLSYEATYDVRDSSAAGSCRRMVSAQGVTRYAFK